MEFLHEYALLFAVAAPVVAIIGLNGFLFLGGERGTLLFPGSFEFPSIEFNRKAPQVAKAKPIAVVSANDELEREAA